MGLKKVLIYTGIWAAIMIGFYVGFWRPRITNLKKTQNHVMMQQAVINQLKRDIESYPKTITAEALKEVEENLGLLFARIPAKEAIPEILKQIRQYSVKSKGLTVTGITSVKGSVRSKEPQDSSIPKVTYQIRAEGNTRDIIQFLYELESGIRLISIRDLKLRRIDAGKHTVSAELTLNIFYSTPENVGQEIKL
ncbi:MAG: type 4a pilus biogenesis protein PilO [Candidatus Poribacteria bacterium]|nr:type 4a pilus biogenesis protein PilO [Candidatus Poribacteria bacterium]